MVEALEVTWKRTLLIWWALTWRVVLTSIIAGIAIGFVVGLIGTGLGIASATLSNLSGTGGFFVGILISLHYFKSIIANKKFSDFEIRLVPLEPINQKTVGESNAH